MNDAWLDFAIRIQSIAQAGLQYGKDKYDIERYEELRRISAEMLAVRTDIPVARFMICFATKQVTRPQKWIRELLYLWMGKFCLFMKTTVHGRCPAAGVMLTSR